MGGKNGKETINPDSYGTGGQKPNEPTRNEQIEKMLRLRAPPNGIITREKFNEILYVLEEIGFPQLRDTPTGLRLFDILAKKSHGSTIRIQDVVSFAKEIASNSNDKQALISFQIMDKDQDNIVTQEEFMIFIQECWSSAFRNLNMLIQQMNKLPPNVPVTSIDDWATSKKQTVASGANEEFKKYDTYKRGFWEFNQFKTWATNSPVNSIIAKLGAFSTSVPLHIVQGGARSTSTDLGFKNINHQPQPQGFGWGDKAN